MMRTAQTALEECPAAFQIYSDLMMFGSMGTQRWTAAMGPRQFRSYVMRRIALVDQLPEPVRGEVGDVQAELADDFFADLYAETGAISSALVDASRKDLQEPSWGLLGRMIEDEMFALMANQLHDATNAVKVPLGPAVERMLPHIEDHPFVGYIESFGSIETLLQRTFERRSIG